MVNNHAINILEKQLNQPINLRIQQNCLQILRNLSDQAVKLVINFKLIFKSIVFSSRKILIHFFVYLLNFYKQKI